MTFSTLSTITSDLLAIIRGSRVVQSEPISRRQLEDWVHQYRSLLLKRDLDKGKMPNPDYIQEIEYLKLEVIDLSGSTTVSGVPVTEVYILKSSLQIPKTIDLNFKSGLTYVGTIAGDEIQFVSQGRTKWQRYKKYTANDSLAYLKDGYMYIESGKPLEYISIRGIFEIPPEVGRFVNPITDQPSFDIDSKYPVPNNLIPTMREMILAKELGIESTAASDTINDAAHNPQSQVISNT